MYRRYLHANHTKQTPNMQKKTITNDKQLFEIIELKPTMQTS